MRFRLKGRNSFYLVIIFLIVLAVFMAAGCGVQPIKDKSSESTGKPDTTQETGRAPKSGSATEDIIAVKENAGKCGQCHAMAPEVATWQLTSHSNFACTTCHDVSTASFSDTTPALPIKMKEEISSDTCKQCHSHKRAYTLSGDLVVPHKKHDKVGISCVKCHSGVVHANIAERGITAQKEFSDLSKWDLQLAEKVVTKYYTQPSMWTCIDCHKSMGITRACAACHSEIDGLLSHEAEDWKEVHGKSGRQNIGECTKCHSIPGEQKFVEPSTGDRSADFARANEFCYSCHTEKPESHLGNILSEHPALAKDRGVANCFTCHNKNKPNLEENVTATYCNQCHWFEEGQKIQIEDEKTETEKTAET